jgi:hypothetical protein
MISRNLNHNLYSFLYELYLVTVQKKLAKSSIFTILLFGENCSLKIIKG